jgi:hypothetical protein
MKDETNLQQDEYLAIALAHLSMIAQAANGDYVPRPGEIETRQAWLIGYLRTGEGLVTDEDRQLARQINQLLGQPESAPLSALA